MYFGIEPPPVRRLCVGRDASAMRPAAPPKMAFPVGDDS
jgi:hypothetical protein